MNAKSETKPALPTIEKFKHELKSKLIHSVRNMRAIRDFAEASKERAKMLQRDELKSLGVNNLEFSVIYRVVSDELEKTYAPDVDTVKKEASMLVTMHKQGTLIPAIEQELSMKALKLANRVDYLVEHKSSFEAQERFKNQIEDIKKLKEKTLSSIDYVVDSTEKKLQRDYNDMKKWSSFKSILPDGTRVPAFSNKEINSLEMMGGWDEIIKIIDQGRFDGAFDNALKKAVVANHDVLSKIKVKRM